MIKIGFFGTPQLARKVLEDLHDAGGFEISFVVTGADKPIGRSQKMTPTPVKEFATGKGIKVLQPLRIRGDSDFLDEIRSHEVDYFIVVAYGKILPAEVLDAPKKMCINVHGSILPSYRGASPIQSALMNGDDVTGVTIMKMSEGMDEGDIIDILKINIDKFDTTETLFRKFEDVSGKFLAETLIALDGGKIGLSPQVDTEATYCKKITKEDGLLDFKRGAKELFHLWRGLTPWPGIYTYLDDKKLIITSCDHVGDNAPGSIGEVVRGEFGIGIRCSDGVLVLKEVKLEGKGISRVNDFANGRRDFIGYRF